SLWLCCDCPVDDTATNMLSQSAMNLRADSLLERFRFVPPECTMRESISKHRVEGLSRSVPAEPFRCDASPLLLNANARAAPVSKYGSWQAMEAASWPIELSWRLIPAV